MIKIMFNKKVKKILKKIILKKKIITFVNQMVKLYN